MVRSAEKNFSIPDGYWRYGPRPGCQPGQSLVGAFLTAACRLPARSGSSFFGLHFNKKIAKAAATSSLLGRTVIRLVGYGE
jgi:hypothetical protein